jgi:thioester reductase-like protein
LKAVHHISTQSVTAATSVQREVFASRVQRLHRQWNALETGYARSKWVAEQLMETGMSRGIPVSIYRLTHLCGSSKTGASNHSDIWSRFIDACLENGLVPEAQAAINTIPVDLMSDHIVDIARKPDSLGKTYDLVNPEPMELVELTQCIVDSTSRSIRGTSLDHWLAECGENALTADLAAVYTDVLSSRRHAVPRNTQHESKTGNVPSTRYDYPPIQREYLEKYVRWRSVNRHKAPV